MDERHKTGRGALLIGLLLLAALPAAVAVNDPGHDSLYVLLTGDSNIIGNLNISNRLNASNLRFATLLYGDYLDIRANTSIYTPSSRPAIQADANDLYLDSLANVYLATRAGTTGRVQIGPTTGSGITLNVSGTILQQNVRVCLANGSNCPGGNNTGNVSTVTAGSGLGNSGTAADPVLDVTAGDGLSISADQVIINNASVCRTSGVGCPAGATAGVGLTNSSGSGNVSLTNNNVNVSLNTLFVDNTNGRVGLGTPQPNSKLHVNGSVNVSGSSANLNIQDGVLQTAGTTRISNTGVGTFATGTTVNALGVCLADGTNCPGGAGSGWLNSSGSGNISLANVNVNISANTLFIDNTNGRVGVGMSVPTQTLTVNGSLNVTNKASSSTGLYAEGTLYGSYTKLNAGSGGIGAYITAPAGNTGAYVFTDSGNSLIANTTSGYAIRAYSTNSVAIYANGSPTQFALYSAQGKNYFSGDVGVGAATPVARLEVNGTGSTAAAVLWVTGGAGSPGAFINLTAGPGDNGTGITDGGAGGLMHFQAGVGGGAVSTNGGAGGSVNISAGAGGSSSSGTPGNGGDVLLYPGLAGGPGASNGSVYIMNGNLGVLAGQVISDGLYTQGNISSTPVAFTGTRYGNTSFAALISFTSTFQHSHNTAVAVGMNFAPRLNNNDKNITRFELLRIVPTLSSGYNGSLGTIYSIALQNPTKSNGSIGSYRGINQADITDENITTVRGIQLGIQDLGTGTRHNLYIDGTAPNHFAGNVGIGSGVTTPANALTVSGDTNTTGTLYIGQAEVRNGFSYVNYTIADVSTSSNTVYTRLNLSLNLTANSQYVIDCNIISDAAAATTGVVLGINLTGGPSSVRATYTSAGTTLSGAVSIETFSGTGTTTNLFADTASFTTPEVSRVAGYVVTGSSTVGWHVDVRSEVGSSAVNVRAGSFCRSTKVA